MNRAGAGAGLQAIFAFLGKLPDIEYFSFLKWRKSEQFSVSHEIQFKNHLEAD